MSPPIATANLLAAHAVAHATAYLDGRHSTEQLGANARRLQLDLVAAPVDLAANRILNPVRLLASAMTQTAAAQGEPGQVGWEKVMGSLVELVRHESRALKDSGAFA